MSCNQNESYSLKNPLCLFGNKTLEIDEKNINITYNNFPKFIDKVYILCLEKEDVSEEENNLINELNYGFIKSDTFSKLSNLLMLLEVDSTIVKNRVHFSKLVLVKSKTFLHFNKKGNDLPEDIFILPILNINFRYLYEYNKLYNMMNLDNLYNIIVLSDLYYDKKDNVIINENILTLIKSLDESKYWFYKFNRNINLSNLFKKRGRNSGYEIKLLNDKKKEENDNESVEYMFLEFDSKKFIDINILKNYGVPLFKDFKNDKYTKADICMLFDRLIPNQRNTLFIYLIISNKYTYLVLNNDYILEMMHDFMIEYIELFRIVLTYGVASLYYHECLNKENLNLDDGCVFNIYTLAKYFPIYPLNYKNPHSNPYLTIPISEIDIDPKRPIGGLPFYSNNELHHKGLVENKEELEKRISVFTTGNSKNNIFLNFPFNSKKDDNYNPKKPSIGITGSMIPAVVFKSHPLSNIVKAFDNSFDAKYRRYYAEYYSSVNNKKSDIDVMIETKEDFVFFDTVNEIFNQVVINMLTFNGDCEPKFFKKVIIKSLAIYVDYKFLKDIICGDELPILIICNNLDHPNVVKLMLPLFNKLYDKLMKKILKDFTEDEIKDLKKKYPYFFTLEENDNLIVKYKLYLGNTNYKRINKISVKSNLSKEEIDNILNVKCLERVDKLKLNIKNDMTNNMLKLYLSFKANIKSPLLVHTFELYKVKNLINAVTMHHFGQVRAYYEGNTLYGPISFFSTCATYRSPDIRWHSTQAIREETEAKWIHRGFGFFLNNEEKKSFINYIKNSNFWADLYGIDSTYNNRGIWKFGPIKVNSPIYRPLVYKSDFYISGLTFPVDLTDPYEDGFNDNNLRYIDNNLDYIKYIRKFYKCKKLDIKFYPCWSENGYMNKVPLSLINYVLDMY